MANRRVATVEIQEILRLVRAGESNSTIAQVLGCNRRTVIKYRAWATAHGLLAGPLPTAGALQQLLATTLPTDLPPQQRSSLAPYREEIRTLREQGVEFAAIRARLEERHGHAVSYNAVRRLATHLAAPAPLAAFVRVEVAPGSEAQVDFGYAGLSVDPATGQPRKSWVFVLVLSWSRHLYAEVVFDQRVETWLLCHEHAFRAWGGVPARIVPDNLKAAIVRASFTEPTAQRAYRECADHYGFLIDPQPPRTPRLKGKVEQGGVHYICRNFLAGRSADEAVLARNQALARWTEQTAGQRIHGTTKQAPLVRFTSVEQALLRPLPRVPYDLAVWKQVQVYRDCYVQFEQSYYSVPFRLVGQRVWVRGGTRSVEISDLQHQVVATHQRATQPGERLTSLDHLPAEKVPGLVITRDDCRLRAAAIGSATTQVVEALLAHRPEDRLRSAGRVLRLAARTSPARLEDACARALAYETADYVTIRRILEEGLDRQAPVPLPLRAPRPYTFVRGAAEFVASLMGGGR
jgi:transposase